jgi:hypothetical protein
MIDTCPLTDEMFEVIRQAHDEKLPNVSEGEVDREVNTILGMSRLMDQWKRENNVDDNFRKKSISE